MRRLPALRRGASAIEFALTLPVLAFFLMAVIEYGWYFNQLIAMTGATRDALRIAVTYQVDGSQTDPYGNVIAQAENRVTNLLLAYGIDPSTGPSGCRVVATPNTASGEGTWTVTLTACTGYESLTLNLVPVPDTITARMTMLLEDQDL
jgi:Flp pilus assembly protein TadG